MFWLFRFPLVTIFLLAIASIRPVTTTINLTVPRGETLRGPPAAVGTCDPDGIQASGAGYRICMPIVWNGDLVVYAHGYVSPTEPVGIAEDQMILPDGTSIADLANLLGFAFAATSYRTNGLAVLEGIDDLVDLVDIFTTEKSAPNKIYLIGISEGGLITTLAVERHPDVFDGGLALCGPYGDFGGQVNHFGDMRVVFDYFFPSLIPGSPINIPQSLIDNWDSYYQTMIKPEIEDPANASLVDQLLAVTSAPYDPADPSTKEKTISDVLWYNVFATNDAGIKLNGQAFDNQDRVYTGSADDTQLNQGVQRFSADQAALDEIAANYQTTGILSVPLVTIHTTGDPTIPYWHAIYYRAKTIVADNIALHEHFEIERYGHCNFTTIEALNAFNRLVDMVNNPPPYQPVSRVYLPLIMIAP